ncbi:MAG: HEPN domain-containing protein [Pseudomonadota bacterium]
MNEGEKRAEVVRYWYDKANKSLESAHREMDAGACSFAMNRIYYAAFYAVSAALLERKLSFKKHSGVRATFHQQFIKTGILDVRWGKLYDQLFEDRQEGDYVALVEFDPEYVKQQMERCAQFLRELKPLLRSLSDPPGIEP